MPIHAEDVQGATELWAAGTGYKASFHDGFAFYPMLGPAAPRHLPLSWRTVSVRGGGEELVAGSPEHSFTDWRFEWRFGRFTEAYDVRAEGVEQTLVTS